MAKNTPAVSAETPEVEQPATGLIVETSFVVEDNTAAEAPPERPVEVEETELTTGFVLETYR
ncbi:hypothetical protein [Sphingomonas sp.]|uniref:hypothetical protein n=1 Tax=Sphingomonas sp. TaxID=28214 RepID=UPI002ED87E77